MPLKINFEFLFVGKEDEGIAKNFFYEKEGLSQGETEKIFITFEMLSNQVLAEEIGGGIFEVMKKKFFEDQSKDPYARFEESLKEVNKFVEDLQKQKEVKFLPTINILITALCGNNLYLTQAGEAEAYLVRRKHVSIISEGLNDEIAQNELFANIANGNLEIGDTVVFSSSRLLCYITEIDLGKIFSHYGIPEALGELKKLLKREISNRTAVLALEIREAEKVQEGRLMEGKKMSAINSCAKKRELTMVLAEKADWARRFFKGFLARFELKFLDIKKLQKNKILAGILTAILVLAVSMYFIQVKGKEKKKIKEYTALLQELRQDIDSAETKGKTNVQQADGLLANAEKKAKKIAESGYLRAEASQVLEAIKKQRDALDDIRRLKNGDIRVLADLSVKRSDVSALGMIPAKNKLFVYGYNTLYEVILDKVEEPLLIDGNETVIAGEYFEEPDSLVFLTKSNKIIEFKNGQFSFMDTEDAAWHGGAGIATFNQYLYILDPEKNQIWKYNRKRDKYSAASAYNEDTDVKNSFLMAIDGSIYILKKDGKMEVLYRGKRQSIVSKKEPLVPLATPRAMYTEPEMGEFYVLDPNNKRVVVYTKDTRTIGALNYSYQYVFDSIGENLRDLYVDKKGQKMYLMDATKVYEADLSGTGN